MKTKVLHKPDERRFELPLDNGQAAHISYRREGDHLSLMHSEVPAALRGQGIGKDLVLGTFEVIQEEGLTATAYCSYIRAVAKRSDTWKDIIQF